MPDAPPTSGAPDIPGVSVMRVESAFVLVGQRREQLVPHHLLVLDVLDVDDRACAGDRDSLLQRPHRQVDVNGRREAWYELDGLPA